MNIKRLLAIVLSVVMVLGMVAVPAFAETENDVAEEFEIENSESALIEEVVIDEFVEEDIIDTDITLFGEEDAVAMVGGTPYATIDEAIEAWTNGKTLTLLSDVTLNSVYKFNSTESRTLNLGTYTLTAASGQHAIEIVCNGQSNATYGLIVNADSENPGGISAPGKSCIYYRKSGTTKDRVIIKINGGVFNGSYAVNVYSSNRGTNCPQVSINGGIFNGNVNIRHGKLIASGGIFNGWVNCTGDSTAYRQISGGTFKNWQFMTADASNKFWVGTSQANYDVGVYVDENNYLVVGGSVITNNDNNQFGAHIYDYSKWSSYLKYSSAAENGLYYEDADLVFAEVTSGTIKLYENSNANATASGALTVECAPGAIYSGNVKLSSDTSSFKVILDEDQEYTGVVTQNKENYLVINETIADGRKTITYTQTNDPASTGNEASLTSNGINTMYKYFTDALNYAVGGDTIRLYKDVVYNINTTNEISLLSTDEEIVIDLNGKSLSAADPEIPTFETDKHYILINGKIEGDIVNNGGSIEIDNVEIAGSVVNNSGSTIVTYATIEGDLILNSGSVDVVGGTVIGTLTSSDEHAMNISGGKFTDDPTLFIPE